MKNGYGRHIFISILLSILVIALFSTCRSRKNVVRTESNQARTERVETKTDTSRVITKTVTDMEESISVHETTTRKTIDLDTLGRVRRIIEESVSKETGSRRHDRGQESVISITGVSESDSTSTEIQEESQEAIVQDVDSRLIQGTEWIWIVVSVGAIIITILFSYFPKRKKGLPHYDGPPPPTN